MTGLSFPTNARLLTSYATAREASISGSRPLTGKRFTPISFSERYALACLSAVSCVAERGIPIGYLCLRTGKLLLMGESLETPLRRVYPPCTRTDSTKVSVGNHVKNGRRQVSELNGRYAPGRRVTRIEVGRVKGSAKKRSEGCLPHSRLDLFRNSNQQEGSRHHLLLRTKSYVFELCPHPAHQSTSGSDEAGSEEQQGARLRRRLCLDRAFEVETHVDARCLNHFEGERV